MNDHRHTLLFLTDLSNGSEEEDIIISNYLRKYFQIIICHPDDCASLEDTVGGIIIRNTWNDSKYGQEDSGYYERFLKKGLKVHDYLYIYPGESKHYLVDLYKAGYPVIPTIEHVRDLEELGSPESYFIKPEDGYSGIGDTVVSKEELLAINPTHYVIQPFIDFEYEISFYYLDKKLQYTLYAPNKKERWDLVEFHPSESDITFAERFVTWNPQKYGIERIDACRLKDGSLLLAKITDQGGTYLSLPLLPAHTKEQFLKNLVASINKNVFTKTI